VLVRLTRAILSFICCASLVSMPTVSLATVARDPVLDDLQDTTSAARSLTLPPAERRREAELQELEDERLERCRSTSPFEFDQCFFFGSMKTVDTRRAMEGGDTLGRPRAAARSTQPSPSKGSAIPTW